MYCEVCHDIHLCKDCWEKHISDSSKNHKMMPLYEYIATLNYPKCRKQPKERRELHCNQCGILFGEHCVFSKKKNKKKTLRAYTSWDFENNWKQERHFTKRKIRSYNYRNPFFRNTKNLRPTSQYRKMILVNTPRNWQQSSINKEKAGTEK